MAGINAAILLPNSYPKELTNKHWQKKKGLVGKTKSTGLGAALDKAYAAFKKIDSIKLDPAANSPKTDDQLDAAIKVAKEHYVKCVEPFRKELSNVEKVATTAAKTLKDIKGGLGKSASKAAEAVATEAKSYSLACKSIDMDGPVKSARDRIQKRKDQAVKQLKPSLAKFAVGAKLFLAEPSKKSWGDNIKQNGRSVSNVVKALDSYNKAFWKDFEKFKGFDLSTLKINSDSEDDKRKQVAIVKAAIKQVKLIAAFKG